MMMKWFAPLYFLVGYFIYVESYDQLVEPGVTVAESSSVGFGQYPNNTVDGDKRHSSYIYCMHTALEQTEAWLRVDLAEVYNLKSVKIWYRDDQLKRRRLPGFSVRLSNTPTPVPIDICYQDPGDQTLPPVLERDCQGEARYVWFYTDRDNDGDGVLLEICEVEIYGCKAHYYGRNCSQRCGHCGEPCHITDGSCPGSCDSGYQGEKCDTACEDGFYGNNCIHVCGHCAGNAPCNHVDGSCPSGYCEPGWKHTSDGKCDQACEDGFYGNNCIHVCGHCAGNAPCNHVDGSCPAGYCEPGWKHTSDGKCDQECDDGTFGYNCMVTCSGHCTGGEPCSKTDGLCPGDCMDGWTNSYCSKKSEPRSPGFMCKSLCSNVCNAVCKKQIGE